MAQLVGDAYIRIFGDTSAMRNALHKEERLLEQRGEDAADSYLLKFNETIEKRAKARMRGTQIAIADAIVSDDFDNLLRRSGQSVDKFAADMREMFTEWERKDYFGTGATGADNFRKSLDSLEVWAEKTRVAEQIRETAAAARKLEIAARAQSRAEASYGKNLLATQKLMSGNRTLMHRYGNDIDMVTVRLNKHSDALGRAFGEGSRSEILNFVGRTIGNLSRIPAMFLDMGSKVAGFFDEIRALNADGTPMIRAIGMTFGKALAGVVASLAATTIGIAAMSQIIPAVIYIVGLLAGAIVAVTGAIGQGLLGVLLPLGPIVLGLVGGIGALYLGISGLADASDKAKKKMKPLMDTWAKFRKDFTEGFVKDITPALSGFVKVIKDSLTPLMDNLSNVIGWLAKRFTDLFNSPAMRPFLDALETSLPHIFQSLGSALIEFGAGITAMFKPILPYAERLAQKIEDAMVSFRKWVSSAAGQNAVRDFMEKAWVAASNLWTIIKNIGSIIWSVFGAGADGPGKDFLSWLAETTTKWAEFLNTPEGQKAMKDFFRDVRDFMLQVKEIFTTIKEKMDQIDWNQVATDVSNFMSAVNTAFRVLGYVFEQVSGAVNTLRDTLGQQDLSLGGIFSDMRVEAEEFGAAMNAHFDSWAQAALGWADSFGANINSGLDTALQNILGWMTTVGETVNGALDNLFFALTDPWIRAWNWLAVNVPTWPGVIYGWMTSIGTTVNGALSNLWFALTDPWMRAWGWVQANIPNWPGLIAGILARIPGAVAGALAGLFLQWSLPFQRAWQWATGEIPQWPTRIGQWIVGIPAAIGRGLSGVAAAFTAPFQTAYENVVGWIATIRRAIEAGIAWIQSHLPSMPDWLPGNQSLAPVGAASFGRGTTSAPTGMRGASTSDSGSALSSLSALTRALITPVGMPQQQQAQKVINIQPGAIIVQAPNADVEQVAAAVVDRIAAKVRF